MNVTHSNTDNMERLSYVNGCSANTQLSYVTIPSLLDKWAKQAPYKPAHIFRSVSGGCGPNHKATKQGISKTVITFQQLAERSWAVAEALLDLGIKSGDCVAILGNNCPEWLYIDHGCLRLGVLMIRVPGNLVHKESLVEVLKKYDIKALFLDGENYSDEVELIIPGLRNGERGILEKMGLGTIQHIIYLKAPNTMSATNLVTLESLLRTNVSSDRVHAIQAKINPDDAAIIYPTSGSTGLPRFTTHGQFGVINYIMISFPHLNENSIFFDDRPFSWAGSFNYASVIHGMTMVHLDTCITTNTGGTNYLFQVLKEEKVTSAYCLPYMVYDMMQAVHQGQFSVPSTLKHITTGGERITEELVKFGISTFDIFSNLYGTTESACAMYTETTSKSKNTDSFYLMETIPFCEIKITNDTNTIVQKGELGVIQHRSPFAMMFYMDETHTQVPAKIWQDTGDLGVMNNDGLVKIVGRSKNIISRGASKIYPQTLENIIVQHDKVQFAIVVPVPDERLFNEICACIIPKPGETITDKEMQSFFNQKTLGELVTPHYYYITNTFPKGSVGKFDKRALAKMAAEHLQLSEKF